MNLSRPIARTADALRERVREVRAASLALAAPLSPEDQCIQSMPDASPTKWENHAHMMAIYFMHYNFVRIHQTLKITPAMAAKVTPKLWEMSDMVKVLEDWETSRAAA